jgi:diaminohydroxyphosphoribosylaminopyrimidine deaminase/5-amino-6-(5-phosphoribosylamino)uracil reductase
MQWKPLRAGFGLAGRIDRTLVDRVDPFFPVGTDEYWMEQALIESMKSVGISAPNPGVGCVIVKNGHELARGHTQAWKQPHAERMAFASLPEGVSLEGAEVFVTLEPCSHTGFQPPCSDLFLGRGIARLVVATADPDPRVSGEGLRRLAASGIRVETGVLEAEVRALLFPFLKTRGAKKTVWVSKWARMPSGHLADVDGNSKWITNAKSRAYTHWLRQKYDAIVVGARTFLLDRPALTVRDCAPPRQRQPLRIVFDPRGDLLNEPESALHGFRVFVCGSRLPEEKRAGAIFHPMEVGPDSPDLVEAFRSTLESMPFEKPLQSVMVEGGARLLRTLGDAGIFDAAHVFTGVQKFDRLSKREWLEAGPGGGFNPCTHHVFDEDVLQEWVKED